VHVHDHCFCVLHAWSGRRQTAFMLISCALSVAVAVAVAVAVVVVVVVVVVVAAAAAAAAAVAALFAAFLIVV